MCGVATTFTLGSRRDIFILLLWFSYNSLFQVTPFEWEIPVNPSAKFQFSYLFIVFNFIVGIKSNSVNAGVPKISYPWLVFYEKVKVNVVFLRDSTGISDSVLASAGHGAPSTRQNS